MRLVILDRLRGSGIGILKQSELELHAQYIGNRTVDVVDAHLSLLDKLLKIAYIGSAHHLHIQACCKTLHCCILGVGAESVAHHFVDTRPVGYDKTVKSPVAAQNIGEQVLVAR